MVILLLAVKNTLKENGVRGKLNIGIFFAFKNMRFRLSSDISQSSSNRSLRSSTAPESYKVTNYTKALSPSVSLTAFGDKSFRNILCRYRTRVGWLVLVGREIGNILEFRKLMKRFYRVGIRNEASCRSQLKMKAFFSPLLSLSSVVFSLSPHCLISRLQTQKAFIIHPIGPGLSSIYLYFAGSSLSLRH